PPTAIYTLSLHDALPICKTDSLKASALAFDGRAYADDFAFQIHERTAGIARVDGGVGLQEILVHVQMQSVSPLGADDAVRHGPRSEEHTSELQSRFDLVC